MRQLTVLMTMICVLWPVVALADWTDEGDNLTTDDINKEMVPKKPAKADCSGGIKQHKSTLPKIKTNKTLVKAVNAHCTPLVKQCTTVKNLVCLAAASQAEVSTLAPKVSTKKKLKPEDILLGHLDSLLAISKVQAGVWSAVAKTGLPAKDLLMGSLIRKGCGACKFNMKLAKKMIKKEKNRARKKMLVDMYLEVEKYQNGVFNAEHMTFAMWSAQLTGSAKKAIEIKKRLEFE